MTPIQSPARWLVVCALLLGGCAHQARIETDPPGAEVFVNGERVGLSPVEIEDPGGWKRDYEITLRKDGYEITQVTLTQEDLSTPLMIAAGVCGVCTCGLGAIYLVPRAWRLDDRYRFVLSRKEPLPAVPPDPPPSAGETSPAPIGY